MNKHIKILIVDDEPAIQDMLGYALMKQGYTCVDAGSIMEALKVARQESPDMILLDWMLPNLDGIQGIKRFKHHPATRDVPIIMVTAKQEEADKVAGLATGAEDYITKPFSTKETIARIEAVLRRCAPKNSDKAISVNGLVLDPMAYKITASGNEVDIRSVIEFKLLHFFMAHLDRVYSRAQLLELVWGSYVQDRTVDVHIMRLRKKLQPYGYDKYIHSIHGVGYRFSVTS